MRFLASVSSAAAFLSLLLPLIIPGSLAGYRPGHPQFLHLEERVIEKRSYFDSLGSLFGKRDDCTTQFGATWVDCGSRGCYQPSLGEVCCGANSLYCLAGQFCTGNNCCPDGLVAACCDEGNGCPANVSSYFTSVLSTPPSAATTSQPISISTPVEVSTTSTETTTSTVAAVTTPSPTTSVAPLFVNSTSSVGVVIGTNSGVVVVTPSIPGGVIPTQSGGVASPSVAKSGAQEMRMRIGVEGVLVGILGIVGNFARLI